MGKRKFTLSYPLYVGCRWCTLFAILVEFLMLDISYKMNCQAMLSFSFTFISLSVLFASALVVLRVYALWGGNRIVIAIASTSWLANVVLLIHLAATVRGHWTDDAARRCVYDNISNIRICIFSTFINDLVLLVLMITGVFRWKGLEGVQERDGILWLMYKQGLAWVVLFTFSEVPPLVFIVLDLGSYMDIMFLPPAAIAMAVGASRLYLGLVNGAALRSPSVDAPPN